MASTKIVNKNNGVSNAYQNANPTSTVSQVNNANETSETSNETYSPTTFDDAIYKAQKEQNYKDYYNTQVQNYIASENAKKYLANEMANRGLGTQGYGTSAHIGINSAYQNARATATESYQNANLQVDQAEAEAKEALSTENDEQLITYLSNSASSTEQADQFMKNYGYTKNSNGIWVDADGNAASAYVVSAYDAAINNLESENDKGMSMSDLRNLYIDPENDKNNNTYDSSIGWELNTVERLVAKGEVESGTVFECKGGESGQTAYIMYKNGKFYIVDKKAYDSATYKKSYSYKR